MIVVQILMHGDSCVDSLKFWFRLSLPLLLRLSLPSLLTFDQDMQEDDESDILNTMAGHQLQTIKDMKKYVLCVFGMNLHMYGFTSCCFF